MVLHYPSNIKKIRGLHGTTQQEFAEAMGVSVNMQKSYETGRAEPDVLYYSRLAKLSKVDAVILATQSVDIADMYVTPAKDEKDEKVARETSQDDVYATYDPLTRREISEMIATNRMQAEAILHLSRNINSGGRGAASSTSNRKGKVSKDAIEELPDKTESDSAKIPRKRKDSVKG